MVTLISCASCNASVIVRLLAISTVNKIFIVIYIECLRSYTAFVIVVFLYDLFEE